MSLLETVKLNFDDLTREEKQDYDRLHQALNTPNRTTDDIAKYLKEQIERLEQELTDYENTQIKDLYLKMSLRNFKSILSFIEAPSHIRKEAAQVIGKINV